MKSPLLKELERSNPPEEDPKPKCFNYEPVEKLGDYILVGFNENGVPVWYNLINKAIVYGEMS